MKNTMRKTAAPLLCGASLLCFAGMSLPASAQDVLSNVQPASPSTTQSVKLPNAPAPQSPEDIGAKVAPGAPLARQDSASAVKPAGASQGDTSDASGDDAKKDELSVEEKRKLLEVDPSVVEAVKAFDRDKFISTRETISKDTIVINQDIERAAAIKKLLDLYGVTAFAAAYPDIYAQIKDSPMVLAAKIDMQKSKNALDLAIDPPKKASDKKPNADSPKVLPPRNDGSQFFAMPGSAQPSIGPNANLKTDPAAVNANSAGVPAQTVPTIAPGKTPADNLGASKADAKPKDAKPALLPISLREIFGVGGKFKAIIVVGEDRWQVKTGDTLDDGTVVKSIGAEKIIIDRDGKDLTLRIGG